MKSREARYASNFEGEVVGIDAWFRGKVINFSAKGLGLVVDQGAEKIIAGQAIRFKYSHRKGPSIGVQAQIVWRDEKGRCGLKLSENLVCRLCDRPGTIFSAKDISLVHSNVRKHQNDAFTVWRCENCRSLHSQESVDLNFYYQGYPLQGQKADLHMEVAHGVFLRRLKKAGLKPHHKILDYGCGIGLFLDHLRKKGYANVAGYDAFVAKHSNREVLDEKYDFVIAQDFVEHMESPPEALTELAGYLKPEGRLCIGTIDADRVDIHDPIDQNAPLHQPYHRHILSHSSLCGLAESVGLKEVAYYDRWYYSSLLPGCNGPFLYAYMAACGDLDAAFEPVRVGLILRSPRLLVRLFLGRFFRDNQMLSIFRRPSK